MQSKLNDAQRNLESIEAMRLYAKLLDSLTDFREAREQGRCVEPDPKFLSPNVPAGYDTVLGFLARTNPEALCILDEDPEATRSDGIWLRARAQVLRMFVVKVVAPAFLQDFGIREVHAYPVELLAERLG
jgi:hypothetical protein